MNVRVAKRPPRLLTVVYFATSSLVILLFASWQRPIWYDEWVIFAFAGFSSVTEVLQTIWLTATNVNQGSTGVYTLVTWVGLRLFGADPWVLRLPALIFSVSFFWAAWIFLRSQKIGWLGVLAIPLIMVGQGTLMYFVGEARPYMPLAAAVAGVLAYYSLPMHERSEWWARLLGWSAVLVGTLFHPYFAIYWPLLLVLAWFFSGTPRTLRGLWEFANIPLVVVGTAAYFSIGLLTWMRGNATAFLDPYLWLSDPVWRAILAQLFQFIYVHRILVVIAGVALLVTAIAAWRSLGSLSEVIRTVGAPIGLVIVAIGAASVISVISVQQGFWIIPRQWIASIALMPLALVWLVSRLLSSIGKRNSPFQWSLALVFFSIVCLTAIQPITDRISQIDAWRNQERAPSLTRAELSSSIRSGEYPSEAEWIEFGQANLDAGGSVWSEFGWYYRGRDWSTFVLSDGTVTVR